MSKKPAPKKKPGSQAQGKRASLWKYNKLREGSGRAPVETPAKKLKRIADAIRRVDETREWTTSQALEMIRAILRPPPGRAAQPAEQCSRCGRPESATCCSGPPGRAAQPTEQEAEFGA